MAIHVAPLDWDHPGWEPCFYPPGLPPEWRLPFFCNEFDALAIPAAKWFSVSEGELAGWAGECSARTRIFLELPAAISAREGSRLAAALSRFGPAGV